MRKHVWNWRFAGRRPGEPTGATRAPELLGLSGDMLADIGDRGARRAGEGAKPILEAVTQAAAQSLCPSDSTAYLEGLPNPAAALHRTPWQYREVCEVR